MQTVANKVQSITSKGQITLPIAWRRRVGVNHITLRTQGDRIEISPIHIPVSQTKTRQSLAALVHAINPRQRHAEVSWGDARGTEVW